MGCFSRFGRMGCNQRPLPTRAQRPFLTTAAAVAAVVVQLGYGGGGVRLPNSSVSRQIVEQSVAAHNEENAPTKLS